MDHITKESGYMDSSLDSDSIYGQMESHILGTGEIMLWMAMEFI